MLALCTGPHRPGHSGAPYWLSDDQLDTIAGKRIELAGKIQEAYGVTTDEAEQQIKRFEDLHTENPPKSLSGA